MFYTYVLSKENEKAILNETKKWKGSKQEKLCKFINEQYGIKGTCIKVETK